MQSFFDEGVGGRIRERSCEEIALAGFSLRRNWRFIFREISSQDPGMMAMATEIPRGRSKHNSRARNEILDALRFPVCSARFIPDFQTVPEIQEADICIHYEDWQSLYGRGKEEEEEEAQNVRSLLTVPKFLSKICFKPTRLGRRSPRIRQRGKYQIQIRVGITITDRC